MTDIYDPLRAKLARHDFLVEEVKILKEFINSKNDDKKEICFNLTRHYVRRSNTSARMGVDTVDFRDVSGITKDALYEFINKYISSLSWEINEISKSLHIANNAIKS